MAISRYKKINVVKNNDSDYKKVFNTRFGSNGLVQTATTTFRVPTEDELLNVSYMSETWSLGQRLYKLAYKHYGNSSYWWVIASASGIGWALQCPPGTVIRVPKNLELALQIGL